MIQYAVIFERIFICCLTLFFSSNVVALEKQLVMGAGPSTVVVTLFFEHFSRSAAAEGYQFEVDQRSIKHAGGIRASDSHLFGRTGRPLSQEEKAQGKREILIANMPLTMVVGERTGVRRISLDRLEKILRGEITNWKQLGGADHKIILVGREPAEVAFTALKKSYDFFAQADFEKIFTRDHQLIHFIKSKKGDYAISFGAVSNFDARYHLMVDGFDAAVNLGLVYDVSNSEHPLVKSIQAFVKTKTWADAVSQTQFQLPGFN